MRCDSRIFDPIHNVMLSRKSFFFLLGFGFLSTTQTLGLSATTDWGNCRADSLFHAWQTQPSEDGLAGARTRMMSAISCGDCDAYIAAQTWMLSQRDEVSAPDHFVTVMPGCDTSKASSSYWYQWGVLAIMEGREMEAEMAIGRATDLACHKMDMINALNAKFHSPKPQRLPNFLAADAESLRCG